MEPGHIRPAQRARPIIVAPIIVGILIGGWAGMVMRGSGMFFSNLILAGCLAVVLAIVGAAALAAGLTGRGDAARAAAGFVGTTVVATVVAYVVAPPYRSPDAGIDHPGRIIVHIAEPAVVEWSEAAICRTRERDTPVFRVSANHQEAGERTVGITLNLGQGSTPDGNELWISVLALPAGITQYLAPPGSGLAVTLDGPDGLTGSARFTAPREAGAYRSPDAEPATLSGTIEWACEPAAAN